jgi:hypothetical protein
LWHQHSLQRRQRGVGLQCSCQRLASIVAYVVGPQAVTQTDTSVGFTSRPSSQLPPFPSSLSHYSLQRFQRGVGLQCRGKRLALLIVDATPPQAVTDMHKRWHPASRRSDSPTHHHSLKLRKCGIVGFEPRHKSVQLRHGSTERGSTSAAQVSKGQDVRRQ